MKVADIMNKILFILIITCMLVSVGGLVGIGIFYNP